MPTNCNNSPTTAIQHPTWAPFCANAYDLPSSTALIRYHHATAGFPVKETWCKAIAKGNYKSWPGLTIELVKKNIVQMQMKP